MSSDLGTTLKLSVFGKSHGDAIGVTVEGLPAGEAIDLAELQAFLDRRRPGTGELTTQRNEADVPEFRSGVTEQDASTLVTSGTPLTAVIRNTDQHSNDYSELRENPRPSHADYTAYLKYGETFDMRGGGPFSGRLTAPMCIAGGICLQMLARRGIFIGAHIAQVGETFDQPFPLYPDEALFREVRSRNPAVVDPAAGEKMKDEIYQAKMDQDSIGGIVECAVIGFPAGVGGPMFDGIEGDLAKGLFGIPAVKGLEFGNGFASAALRGSENNDAFVLKDGHIATETNRSGGIQGGISNGMPLVFRVALKPTPSISKPQKTVNRVRMEETELTIKGRHDPCVVLRAVPVVEAVAAIVLTDLLLGEGKLV